MDVLFWMVFLNSSCFTTLVRKNERLYFPLNHGWPVNHCFYLHAWPALRCFLLRPASSTPNHFVWRRRPPHLPYAVEQSKWLTLKSSHQRSHHFLKTLRRRDLNPEPSEIKSITLTPKPWRAVEIATIRMPTVPWPHCSPVKHVVCTLSTWQCLFTYATDR